MKNIIRYPLVFLLLSPVITIVHLSSLFKKREGTVKIFGQIITTLAEFTLHFWSPAIDKPEDFHLFKEKMKKNLRLWKPIADFNITEETDDIFKMHVSSCTFCEVLMKSGLSDISPYVCAADWKRAEVFKDKWLFDRKHQIGTGDSFCDHTYKRIK